MAIMQSGYLTHWENRKHKLFTSLSTSRSHPLIFGLECAAELVFAKQYKSLAIGRPFNIFSFEFFCIRDMSVHGPRTRENRVHLRAGTLMHSAISSSSPTSPTHSSLHINTLCVPQHKTRLPLRTGFQRTLSTGLLWSNTLRNRGVNSCCGTGKSKIWTAAGVFPARGRLSFDEDLERDYHTKSDQKQISCVIPF